MVVSRPMTKQTETLQPRVDAPKVLIVEDDDAQRITLADIVSDEGFSAVTCANGDDALDLTTRGVFAVAIVDQRLPGVNGTDLVMRLKGIDPELRIIVHTAYGSFDSAKASINLGVFAYVEKPGDPGELIRHVQRAVQERLATSLRRTQQRLAGIFAQANDGIFIVDPVEQTIVDVNPSGAAMLGYAPEEVAGAKVEKFHPHDLDRLRSFLDAVMQNGSGFTEGLSCTHKSGELIPAEYSASRIRDGDRDRVMMIVRDISERRRSQQALKESEQQLRLIADNVSAMLCYVDAERRFKFVNRRYAEFFGHSVDEAVGKHLSEVIGSDIYDSVLPYVERVFSGETVNFEQGRRSPSGDPCWIDFTLVPDVGSDGAVRGYYGLLSDISERRAAAEALRKSEARYQGLFDDAPDMYFTITRDGTIRSINQLGADYLGFNKNELVGSAVMDLVHPDDREMVEAHLDQVFEHGTRESELEFRKVRKDGGLLWVNERIRHFDEKSDADAELRIVCRDVTEAHALSEELSFQATHDPLTGLINRRELENRLERVLHTAQNMGVEHALCYLDLDQFKVINDTCGHIAGDELLRQLGDLLPSKVRKRDTLARLGGDEFAVLMEHCPIDQAERVAHALRSTVEEFRFAWEDKTFNIGVSIGLVSINSHSRSVDEVLSAADTACYMAKERGRNRIYLYDPGSVELARRHGEKEWVSRISQALEANRFELFYQPIRHLDPSRKTGAEGRFYELLLRMTDVDGELVYPGAFLPAAERFNLSTRLDQWVLSRAFDWLKSTPGRLDDLYLCSINLSGHSLADQEFHRFVLQQFADSGIPGEKICFEVAETAAIANFGNAARFISAIKDLGCRFALDDFGSGLSSFAYLKHLAVDFLKIDGVFVKDIVDDPIDFAMVKSINEIGQVMGKKTIAEFVEGDAILEKLGEIGVDFVQGYAVGRPRPLSTLPESSASSRQGSAG
jgi:diguanylate cyclase (GGDEF)-like protein/PAS domain S-box-containing protein